MQTIMLVFGTRPEAIKMCPLVLELKKNKEAFNVIVCVTGQHREMLDQVLNIFGIDPDYDLNIMTKGQDLYDVTSRVLLGLRDIFKTIKPDLVLVHGDTTTSTAAALASFYQHIPVGHVEAGLRTYNTESPYPEEFYRRSISIIAKYNFATTENAVQNLLNERIPKETVYLVGNTVYDTIHLIKSEASSHGSPFTDESKRYLILTTHRRENLSTLDEIYRAINQASKDFDLQIITAKYTPKTINGILIVQVYTQNIII